MFVDIEGVIILNPKFKDEPITWSEQDLVVVGY